MGTLTGSVLIASTRTGEAVDVALTSAGAGAEGRRVNAVSDIDGSKGVARVALQLSQ